MAIDTRLAEGLRELLGERVAFDEPMAKYTSLRVGGPADALARPGSREELVALVALCRERGAAILPLGAGFNTLALDAGVRAVVVRLSGLRAIERLEGARLRAEAGATHASVCRRAADEGLAGLEFAVGIPGTVGGWLAMNAGIPEREMKDVVERVELLEPDAPGPREVEARELGFRYRALELPAGALILSATFALEPDEPERIRARMKAYLDARRDRQPVDQPSCGSVFENPPGDHAGRLIEAAGLKGEREGNARISTLHANFIVNLGGASAADVLRLIERTRDEVRRRTGVELRTEVKIRGEAP
jgi:UDP-N-acetylmuramate dehydrogenase